MIYATPTDMLTRFDADEIAQRTDRGLPRLVTAQLMRDVAAAADLSGYTSDQAAAGAVALTIVERALNDARDTIDSQIGGRYSLPISPVPAVLQRVACDLARYYLYDDQVTEAVKDRYDEGMKLLRGVASGATQLGPEGSTGEQPTSTAGAELVSGERVWRRNQSTGFL